jgi:2,3-bisphosphoglycerate-dependent phosphoglycerate mutase
MSSHTSRPPTTLLLCRHGQSEWNVQRRIQGQAPEAGGLTEQGRWEAHQLGRRLQALNVDALYASDLLRAWQTAEIVSAAVGLPVQPDPRWREIDLGVWQGMQPEEVDARWSTDEIREQDLPRGETGETFAALTRRTLAAIDDLHARHGGQTIAVVCHGGNVRAALMATTAPTGDGTDPRRAPIPNTSVTIMQVNSAGPIAALIADASHLDSATPDPGETNADEQR